MDVTNAIIEEKNRPNVRYIIPRDIVLRPVIVAV